VSLGIPHAKAIWMSQMKWGLSEHRRLSVILLSSKWKIRREQMLHQDGNGKNDVLNAAVQRV